MYSIHNIAYILEKLPRSRMDSVEADDTSPVSKVSDSPPLPMVLHLPNTVESELFV
jgi:hypothetical protein